MIRAPARGSLSASTGSADAGVRGEVMLCTLDVPFDEEACALAVDAAVETGQTLAVVNVAAIAFLPLSANLGYDAIEDPSTSEALRRPASLARALGVHVERIKVRTPRPAEALLELVAERRPAFLVLGPDRSLVRPHLYRKAARAVSEGAGCLVWLASGS